MLLSTLFTLLVLQSSAVYTYKILFMCPYPALSHWLWIENFARELVNRGHEVTAVTNHKTDQPHPNYTEIIIDPFSETPISRIPYHYSAYRFRNEELFELKFNNDFHNLFMWWDDGIRTSDYALNDTEVKKLIQSKDLNFDLIILEQFFHESFLMFAHKFKAPIVTIGTFGYADNMDQAMGLITPWSFVPHIVLPSRDSMTFLQRVYNTVISVFDYTLRRLYYLPKQQDIANKHFKGIPGPLPSVLDLEKSISLMLINSHRSTSRPRPSMPGLINVGGVHIKPVKPLPADINEFLDSAEHGVIYFSLGSYVKSSHMPREKLAAILETFRRLKQKVLWKYEDDTIGKLPSNIMIKKWMPQSDILGHKNVVLFITHGGLFGTQEAIYRGVPMLCMPLYADQNRNAQQSVQDGYALSISFKDINIDSLYLQIQAIITNKRYAERAKEMSNLFRDNPMHPLDESMYWIEYIMRHKGAKHLKSPAVSLPWYQYLLFDVVAFFLISISLSIYLSYKILQILLRIFVKKNKID